MKKTKVCKVCGCNVSKNSKKGYCNKCVPRNGKNNPFYGKKHKKETIIKIREKNSEISKKLWENDEYRKSVIAGATGKKRSDGFKETQRKHAIKQFSDDKQREIRRISMKNNWKSGKIPLSDKKSYNKSKCEIEIFKTLSKTFKNVKRKTIKIDNKWYYPDILIDNKIIVEYFGDYWHGNPKLYSEDFIIERTKNKVSDIWEHDKIRMENFKNNGYHVIVIWEKEYKEDKNKYINDLIASIKKTKYLKG